MELDLAYFNIKAPEDVNFEYIPKNSLIDNLPEYSFIVLGDKIIIENDVYIANKQLVDLNTYTMDRRTYRSLTFGIRYGSTKTVTEQLDALEEFNKINPNKYFEELSNYFNK